MRRTAPLSLIATLAFALALTTAAGCKTKQPEARAVTPPSAEEAEAFGKELAKHLAPCDTAGIDRLFDIELLIARGVANRRVGDREVRGLARGIGSLGTRLCAELGGQSIQTKYLRTQTVDGAPRPLIRLVFDAGVNYYQVELDKRDNTVKGVDIYIYLAGEKLSESFGRLLDVIMKAPNAVRPETMTAMKADMQAGRWDDAQTKFDTFPDHIRKSKPMRLIELQIASELGDDRYVAVMDSYAKAFPNDPSLALVQIDRTILKKQYNTTLALLDELDKLVGGDPYLDVLRVDAFISQARHADAIKIAERATTAEPDLEHMWWALLSAQAAAGKHAEAIATLTKLRDTFGVDFTGLAADERFTALAESEPVQKWLANAP